MKVIGAEDKRQNTVCVASSLDGDFLPLQLVFTGKTKACVPEATAASIAASTHLTFSENHWSSQETMQQYVNEIIVPFAKQRVIEHGLQPDSHIVLVLDVWSVHKSAEFRKFMRDKHPNIHLVFVPANCTSKLQVADVMHQASLQRVGGVQDRRAVPFGQLDRSRSLPQDEAHQATHTAVVLGQLDPQE